MARIILLLSALIISGCAMTPEHKATLLEIGAALHQMGNNARAAGFGAQQPRITNCLERSTGPDSATMTCTQ